MPDYIPIVQLITVASKNERWGRNYKKMTAQSKRKKRKRGINVGCVVRQTSEVREWLILSVIKTSGLDILLLDLPLLPLSCLNQTKTNRHHLTRGEFLKLIQNCVYNSGKLFYAEIFNSGAVFLFVLWVYVSDQISYRPSV